VTDPIPVVVTSPDPLPVTVVNRGDGDAPATTTAEQDRQTAGERLALRTSTPTTTEEQDRKTAGQRHINVMWERTQQVIAILVTFVTLMACSYLVWRADQATAVPAFLLLSNVFFLVVGTYFQRTNHTKTSSGDNTDFR